MTHGITYSDENMTRSADRCVQSMQKHGIDNAFAYNPYHISNEFMSVNRDIFDGKRGAGCYWMFKPYIINRHMIGMLDGDILIYSDAGVEFVNDVKHIIDVMDQDIFFFTNGWPHVEWCKGDVWQTVLFRLPTDGQVERLKNYKQVQASVIFFKVNQTTRNLVKEWLLYCQMPGFIDDSPSKFPNYPTFAEHRHDQAILTCLQIKYRYKLHWWPTQYSEHIRVKGDNYPVMFSHHRKRNHEW